MSRLCCFFNYNPLYRLPIYRAMDQSMACDFYFGDSVFEPLKQFPPEELKGFRRMFHTVKTGFKDYKWHQGIGCLFHGYDDYLITGQIDYLANWLIILYAKLRGKHVYCWTHGISRSEISKPISRRIYRTFFKSMDGIFMYNRFKFTIMRELGIDEKKMHVIHNSLDTEEQTKLYQQLTDSGIYRSHFGNDCPTIIYIGRIQARKKLDLLIEALSIINGKDHQANLVIVGAPTDDDSIQELVVQKNLQNAVWFYGPCFDEATNAELLYNAAVCVCPAAVGLTAIHALTYGTPVVSNDNFEEQMPEFEAIRNGVTGSFYKSGDINSLVEEILRWTKKSPAERIQIRYAARTDIEREWSVDYQMGVFQEVFSQHAINQDK